MSARRLAAPLLALAGVLALSACGSSSTSGGVDAATFRSPTTTAGPTTTTSPEPGCDENTTAHESYAPIAPLPSPGAMPDPSPMKTIQDRGYLKVGVDQNTEQLSARNPDSHELEGFEVDIAGQIADAILGDPSKVRFVNVVTEQKVPFARDGSVDLTVSAVSMTCGRWGQVDFSDQYLTTSQRVLVRTESPITDLSGLAHRKVCVTKGGTTFEKLQAQVAGVIKVELPARTDCLVALQDGTVDGIVSHATILYGLHRQDIENTRLLDGTFSDQYYGIAVKKDGSTHEFARFLNGVLERLRDDGMMTTLFDKWLGVLPPNTAELPNEPLVHREEGT